MFLYNPPAHSLRTRLVFRDKCASMRSMQREKNEESPPVFRMQSGWGAYTKECSHSFFFRCRKNKKISIIRTPSAGPCPLIYVKFVKYAFFLQNTLLRTGLTTAGTSRPCLKFFEFAENVKYALYEVFGRRAVPSVQRTEITLWFRAAVDMFGRRRADRFVLLVSGPA